MSKRGEAPQLNALSCRRCNLRKVRCSRTKPTCQRCVAQGTECVYPERVKRKARRQITTKQDHSLALILERLEKVEQQVVLQPEAKCLDRSERHAVFQPEAHEVGTPRPVERSLSSNTTSPTHFPSACLPEALGDTDITAAVTEAASRAQELRLRSISQATLTGDIHIPPDLAKTWIDCYFKHNRTEIFQEFIDPKLFRSIPDIIDYPQIHIEAATLVVYYCILYIGLFMADTPRRPEEGGLSYTQQLYVCCLRSLPAWQREATGTRMDFLAGLFMAQVASDHCDHELGWQIYKSACEHAEELKIHHLDNTEIAPEPDQARLEADRKGFWDLINIDFFFRLIYNKPPAFAIKMEAWRVNLPWLSPVSKPDFHAIPTVTFIIRSRITFILIRFFSLLEDRIRHPGIEAEIELLCREIESLFEEWEIESWIQTGTTNKMSMWMLYEIAFTGYTCIVLMLRQVSIVASYAPNPIVSDKDQPRSPLAVNAARSFLHHLDTVLDFYPRSESLSMMLGFYQAATHFGCLAHSIVTTPDPCTVESDLAVLERISAKIMRISEDEKGFRPFSNALHSLCKDIGTTTANGRTSAD